MKVELTEKEIQIFAKDEKAIRTNLVSKVLYNESLSYEFSEEDLKNIWFNEENLILGLYMRKKVEPRLLVTENSIIEAYNNNKAYFEENKINFENAREILKNRLTEEANNGLFEDLVKKLMNEMEDKVTLTKEDILFTKGNPELIKAILLISVLKENAEKDGFFKENEEEIELLRKDARLNYYLNRLIETNVSLTNKEVLDKLQEVTKDNFDLVKSYSQEQLFNEIGDAMLNEKAFLVREDIFKRIIEENDIENKVKEYTK